MNTADRLQDRVLDHYDRRIKQKQKALGTVHVGNSFSVTNGENRPADGVAT